MKDEQLLGFRRDCYRYCYHGRHTKLQDLFLPTRSLWSWGQQMIACGPNSACPLFLHGLRAKNSFIFLHGWKKFKTRLFYVMWKLHNVRMSVLVKFYWNTPIPIHLHRVTFTLQLQCSVVATETTATSKIFMESVCNLCYELIGEPLSITSK